jgi:hypothetical protein
MGRQRGRVATLNAYRGAEDASFELPLSPAALTAITT